MSNIPGITILGLGPGDPSLLTRQAWHVLESITEIYLRTKQHPTVNSFPKPLTIYSYDYLYENAETFEAVYEQIVEQIIKLGSRPRGVVYAVPGHPFVAEATSHAIYRQARDIGLPVRIIEGLSFLEPTFTALAIDPLPHIAIVDALELVIDHVPPFPPDAPALIAQIHSPSIATEVKLTLMEVYPDEHPVKLVHASGTPLHQVETLPLYQIDRSPMVGMTTTLFLPGLEAYTSFESFQEIIAHLRAPEGCPWDREQTHQSLRPHLLEETYEALDALDKNDPAALQEELGDILLQIVLHAQIANEYGEFSMADILKSISAKIIQRHPHVFGDLKVEGVEHVLKNWEVLKAAEREANGKVEDSILDGITPSLPALAQADQYQRRVARVGFDWPDIQGVIQKVNEELSEVIRAEDLPSRADEVGDLLFTIVNLARHYEIDAESALRETNARFRKRFRFIEDEARAQGKSITALSLDEMDAYWQLAKGI